MLNTLCSTVLIQTEIDKTLGILIQIEMNLNVEDDMAGFLGFIIKRLDNNKIELTQTNLIKPIREALGIVDANPKATPAKTESLQAASCISEQYYTW